MAAKMKKAPSRVREGAFYGCRFIRRKVRDLLLGLEEHVCIRGGGEQLRVGRIAIRHFMFTKP